MNQEMTKQYLIGVDLGTSATKTILIDESGTIVASASCAYPMYQPENGWAEQNPQDWKNAALATIKEVMKTSGVAAGEVAGIGLSGQMHGLVMLDEKNELVDNAIIWCDQRSSAQTEEMLDLLPMEKWIEISANPPIAGMDGCKNTVGEGEQTRGFPKVQAHSSSERLHPAYPDRCICNGCIGCFGHADFRC